MCDSSFCIGMDVDSVEDLDDFFQAESFRFGKEQPRCHIDNNHNTDKDKVVVPTNVVQSNGIAEGQNDERSIDGEHLYSDALSSDGIW